MFVVVVRGKGATVDVFAVMTRLFRSVYIAKAENGKSDDGWSITIVRI